MKMVMKYYSDYEQGKLGCTKVAQTAMGPFKNYVILFWTPWTPPLPPVIQCNLLMTSPPPPKRLRNFLTSICLVSVKTCENFMLPSIIVLHLLRR